MSEYTFIEQSPSEGAEHAVEQGTTIGREGCDITLGDPDVSRRHAEIQVSNGDILINDLGSTNGTFVNGERIDQPRALSDGDEVRIGAVVLRLRAPAAQAGATRIAGTMDAGAATPSQATTVRPVDPVVADEPAPAPADPEPTEPMPAADEPATPAAPDPVVAEEPAAAPAAAAADQPTAHSPAAAAPPAPSRGDVPQPDFAPSAIRRVVPVDAPTAFTPDTQVGRRGGSAATRGGATLFTTIVIAATTAGVLIYYITEPFK